MRAHFLQKKIIILLVHSLEFLENLIKNYCIRPHFGAEWVDDGLINTGVYFRVEDAFSDSLSYV